MQYNIRKAPRFNGGKNKITNMEQISTQDLLLLHAYGETTEEQKAFLALEMAKDPGLIEEFMELVRAKRMLNKQLLTPSNTSVRIIMEHSYQTEHLHEI